MPCLLMHRPCKVCGQVHNFFFAGGELSSDRRYQYCCPETGQEAYWWEITNVEAADQPPAGGVELHESGERSGRD